MQSGGVGIIVSSHAVIAQARTPLNVPLDRIKKRKLSVEQGTTTGTEVYMRMRYPITRDVCAQGAKPRKTRPAELNNETCASSHSGLQSEVLRPKMLTCLLAKPREVQNY